MKLAVALSGMAAASTLSLAARAEPPAELSRTSAGALGLETGVAVAVFASYSIATGDPKTTCGWCATNGFDRAGHDALVVHDRKAAGFVSHVPSYGLIPLGAVAFAVVAPALDGHGDHALENGWIIANAALLTLGLTDGTKKLVSRQRPMFHYGTAQATEYATKPSEQNLSFFSGDTSIAFQVAATTTTLAYLRGYRSAPWLALTLGTLAATTGVLRIAAEAHWPTDVLTGAVVGTGVGIGVPTLLHARRDAGSELQVVPSVGPGHAMLVVAGRL